jgi:hypothetical protein
LMNLFNLLRQFLILLTSQGRGTLTPGVVATAGHI